jgi:AcrR family transcriptional regulator
MKGTPICRPPFKEAAWKQIAELGATALNLRGIARDLEIAAPSIYNYFPNRDDLITALIVDAFASLADSQVAAISAIPENEHAQRLLALGLNYREWAMAKPERYQLIFGTPLAGYIAPLEITQPVAGRSLAILMNVVMAGHAAGKLRPETGRALSPQLQTMFTDWQQQRGAADGQVQFLALSIWGHVHGLVSVEIGLQYPPFITDPGEVYRHALGLLVLRYFPDSE